MGRFFEVILVVLGLFLAVWVLSGCAIGENRAFWVVNDGVEPEKAAAFERAATWWGVELAPDGDLVVLKVQGDAGMCAQSWDVPACAPWWDMEVHVSPAFDQYSVDDWEATMAHEWGHILGQCSGHLEQRTSLMSSPHHGHTVEASDWDYIHGGCP